MKKHSNLLKFTIISLIFGIVATIFAPVFSSEIQNLLGIGGFIMICIVVVVIPIVVFCVILILLQKSQEIFQRNIETIICDDAVNNVECENIICPRKVVELATAMKSPFFTTTGGVFFDEAELQKIETNFNGTEIWLFSYDLEIETLDLKFSEIVRKNLSRGIKYRIFCLNNENSIARKGNLEKRYEKYSKNLKIEILSQKELDVVISMHQFVIYQPFEENGGEIQPSGYLCLGENDKEKESLYKKMSEAEINRLVATINRLYLLSKTHIISGS